MLMGSTDDEIADMNEPVDLPEVINDLSDDKLLKLAQYNMESQYKVSNLPVFRSFITSIKDLLLLLV